MLRRGPFTKFFSKPGVGLAEDFPTTLDNLELFLTSRDFIGTANNTAVGESGVRPWEDHSGQTQGTARDGVQGTAARRPVVKTTGGFEAPNGVPTVSFISQTNMAINPNPFKQLGAAVPSGVSNPWDTVTRGHTFLFGGRFYDMLVPSALWADLLDNRAQLNTEGGPLFNEPQPYLRSNAGTFYQLNTASIWSSTPLPWGAIVMRFNPPKDTNGGVDFLRWDYAADWTTFSPAATVQWDTGGATGWKLSGNASFNIPQNMDLGWVLWYSDVVTQAELDLLMLWNNIWFGHE